MIAELVLAAGITSLYRNRPKGHIGLASRIPMSNCPHSDTRCLNQYDTLRKYECLLCGNVLMCECERELALEFLPHQTRRGQEYGTRKLFPVSGFAPRVCPECRGADIKPYPMAEASRTKGKVARFYWREVFKTYCCLILIWAEEEGIEFDGLLGFEAEHPQEAKNLRREATRHWQEIHKRTPKYDMTEPTLEDRMGDSEIPERVFEAVYEKIETPSGSQVGKWRSKSGDLVSAEDVAMERYLELGYNVVRCERRIISAWVGTFLCHPIQQGDSNVLVGYRRSTKEWSSRNQDTPIIEVPLPRDFGSREYYQRRSEAIDDWIQGLSASQSLVPVFDALVADSESLRDYLWVNDDEVLDDARAVLSVVDPQIVAKWIRWAIGSFWERQPGWPDFFISRAGEYFFSEVKSPLDNLSQEQKRWFQWALKDERIPAEICRIRKAT